MKTLRLKAFQLAATAAASVLCLRLGAEPAPADAGYPSVIQADMGASEFAPGDTIVITSVRGDREHLVPGGRYVVYGSYTLASTERADLAWYATLHGVGGSTPIADSEHFMVTRGSGTFRLEKTLLNDGWLHLQFSVNGRAHGGIYFGEKGFESTVLRRKAWSDFSDAGQDDTGAPISTRAGGGASPVEVTGNFAIMAYLGEPVPAPAGLDPRYSAAGLKAAFTELSKRQGLTLERLDVDDSEFPYVIYGLLTGRCDYHVIADGVAKMSGYGYGGSVTGYTQGGATYFSINITPDRLLPSGPVMAYGRRLTVRLQMLADIARAGTSAPAPRVTVLFDKPEGYTDRMLSYGPDWFHEAVFSTLQNFLVKLGDQLLPAGYSLKLTFTDIDIGGRDSDKVPASVGLPAFEFTYEVKDGAGTVVKQGAEKLSNYTDFENYLISIPTADTAGMKLRFEKAMLKSWLTKMVESLKKG